MDVTIETRTPADFAADMLALPLAELDPARWRLPRPLAALDAAAGGRIAQAIGAGDFRGKRGETLLLHPAPALRAKRLLLIGLGAEASLSADALREVAAGVVREARRRRAERVALLTPAVRRLKAGALAQA